MDLNLPWYEWVGLALGGAGLLTFVRFSWMRRQSRRLDRMVHRIADNAAEGTEFDSRWATVLDRINAAASDKAILYRLSLNGPADLSRQSNTDCEVLVDVTSKQVATRATKIRANPKLNNKPHGFADTRDVRVGASTVRFVPGDYAIVLAAREAGLKPPALSGNAIVFCQTSGEVLLQFRGATATYRNCIHIFGGNYEPAVDVAEHDDQRPGPSLKTTALREVGEECGLRFDDIANPLVIFGEELTTGFVRYTYAGLSVPAGQREQVRAPPEGPVRWVSFEKLARYAKTGKLAGHEWHMVPSGALDLMMWLALGAPDQFRETPNKEAALEAYEALVANAAVRIAANP